MDNDREDIAASSWKMGPHFYGDAAQVTLKWFLGSALFFVIALGLWFFEWRGFEIISIFFATATVTLYILFQTQLQRADMAQYHYIMMLQNETLNKKIEFKDSADEDGLLSE